MKTWSLLDVLQVIVVSTAVTLTALALNGYASVRKLKESVLKSGQEVNQLTEEINKTRLLVEKSGDFTLPVLEQVRASRDLITRNEKRVRAIISLNKTEIQHTGNSIDPSVSKDREVGELLGLGRDLRLMRLRSLGDPFLFQSECPLEPFRRSVSGNSFSYISSTMNCTDLLGGPDLGPVPVEVTIDGTLTRLNPEEEKKDFGHLEIHLGGEPCRSASCRVQTEAFSNSTQFHIGPTGPIKVHPPHIRIEIYAECGKAPCAIHVDRISARLNF